MGFMTFLCLMGIGWTPIGVAAEAEFYGQPPDGGRM
jgi:hypothetical protein